MGGGHRRANPRRGDKGPLRGDRRREEVAGRKRIAREYREKVPSHIPLAKPVLPQDLSATEYRILYAAERRKAYGYERSMDLGLQLDIQRVPGKEREAFVEAFKDKLQARGWGDVYPGPDGRRFFYIDEQAIFEVRRYLEAYEP